MDSGASVLVPGDDAPGGARSDSRRGSRAPSSARACTAPKRCWRGTSASPWWWYSMSRTFGSSDTPDVVVRAEDQAGPFRARNCRTASISSGAAACSVTMWSRPNTNSVSVSARTRSSSGSGKPAWSTAGTPGRRARSSRRRTAGTAPRPRRTAPATPAIPCWNCSGSDHRGAS